MKKIFFLSASLSVFSLFGAEKAASTRLNHKDSRQLVVLVEAGRNEHLGEFLYFNETLKNSITTSLIDFLQSDPQVPILVSEHLMKNFFLYYTLGHDILRKTDHQLKLLYGKLKALESQKIFDEMTGLMLYFQKKMRMLKELVKEHKNKEEIKIILNESAQGTKTIASRYMQQNGKDITSMTINAFTAFNAYDPKKWALGRVSSGDFIFAPKSNNTLIESGLNYEKVEWIHLDTEKDLYAWMESSRTYLKETSKLYQPTMAHPERIIKELEELTQGKRDTQTPLDILWIGHGHAPAGATPLIEMYTKNIESLEQKINTLPHDRLLEKDLLKNKIMYLEEYRALVKKQQTPYISIIGGMVDADFNNQLVPVLEKANTRTFTYITCYGGDINTLRAWKSATANNMGTHSFTIINATLLLTSISKKTSFHFEEIERMFGKDSVKEIYSDQSEAPKNYSVGKYLNNLSIDFIEAIKSFFETEKIRQTISTVPQIKLATTDYWIPLTELKTSLLYISTLAARTRATNAKPFVYNKGKGGTILLGCPTLLAPLKIEGNPDETPSLIPVSINHNIHYIDTIILPNESTLEGFLKQSLRPFYEPMAHLSASLQKTLIINNLIIGPETYQVIVYKGYAFYNKKNAPTPELSPPATPTKNFPLAENPLPLKKETTEKELGASFKRGFFQASQEKELLNNNSKAWQTSIATIKRRQSLLKILNTITKKKKAAAFDWAAIAQQSEKEIITSILEEVSKEALEEKLLLELSEYELQLLESIKKKK